MTRAGGVGMTALVVVAAISFAGGRVPGARAAAAVVEPAADDNMNASPVRPPAAVPVSAPGDGSEPTRVTVTPAQQILTLGLDTGTTLLVSVSGPDAAQATPGRTQSTVGEIGPLVPQVAAGTFVAEYRLPPNRQPQSAIIAVEVLLPGGRHARGTAHLVMPAATDFPLRTSPNAAVSLEIAGTVFGPRKADAAGNVRVPIVVPPGVATGLARAVNRFGVTKETEVDLQQQEYSRVLLLAPLEGVAGSPVDVEVWAVEVSGDPSLPEDIDLTVSAGKVRRLGGVPGVAIFSFTPPGHLAPPAAAAGGPVALPIVQGARLTAAMRDGTSPAYSEFAVRAGDASLLAITTDLPRLVIASGAVAQVLVRATDRFGNPVPAAGLVVTADGQPLPLRIADDQAWAKLPAPPSWRGKEHVAVQAVLGPVRSVKDVPLTGDTPAVATVVASATRVDANGTNAVDLTVTVVDAHGTPAAQTHVAWQTDDDGTIRPLPSPRLGTYVAQFVPRRALRDRAAVIAAVIDPGLTASTRIRVEAGATRTVAVRIGVASNLGSFFGQSAFVEATAPLTRAGRFGRLISAGVGLGYLHSELTTARASAFPGGHIDVSQAPLLALGRVRIPGGLPFEVSVSGAAGMTFAATAITPTGDTPFDASRGTAYAIVLGGGVDASVLLQPGELVLGARYLHAELGRDSNGDQLGGNSLGVICDLGFRIGF